MVEQISAEQAYMNHVLKQLPQAERGEVYEIKSKDNLWEIAKRKLGSKKTKLSRGEIQNYMYQIAKLNNLNTIEKMNTLKVKDKIYLPKEVQAANGAAVKSQKVQKASQQRPSAETSLLNLTEKLKTDKSIKVEKMYKGYDSPNDLYHVFCYYKDPKSGYQTSMHPLVTFTKDNRTGKITSVSFDDDNDKDPIRSDYNMDANGNIETNSFSLRKNNVGKIGKEELNELHNLLNSKIASSNIRYSF